MFIFVKDKVLHCFFCKGLCLPCELQVHCYSYCWTLICKKNKKELIDDIHLEIRYGCTDRNVVSCMTKKKTKAEVHIIKQLSRSLIHFLSIDDHRAELHQKYI